jgi:UDP-GlcNAc:undecaprenyl-phosphate/decaprenyl-phosphate GlcNAc-1-phosphate transferase
VDVPIGERKIHTRPIPFLGGVGIAVALCVCLWVVWSLGFLQESLRARQLIGFVVGIIVLAIGGALDDAMPQPPRIQILFPIIAALCVIAGGTGIVQITDPTSSHGFSLVWWRLGSLSLPSDLITFVWLLVATYATKVSDGLDGLVTGLTIIGASFVGALSFSQAYFQPAIGTLAGIVGGAFLGFFPRNRFPAKQFLGEAGSTIAGFSLGVLAIVSSAKIAIALAVLAIPITDVGLVVLGRVKRGAPWFRGDATHLHHRLIQAGLPQQVAVLLYWGVALIAGIAALSLQTRGKIFLIVLLCVLAALASYVAGLKARSR